MSAKLAEVKPEPTAVEIIASLDIEKLEARKAVLQKELDALNALIKAAVIGRDGKPRSKYKSKKQKEQDKAAHSQVNSTATSSSSPSPTNMSESEAGSLLARLKAFLNQAGATRAITIAKELRADQEKVERLLKANPSIFTQTGPGWWRCDAD